ncbi:alcohol dehydrogenase catalytic domain-containing protein [Microbacterium suaedae]|uniref:alcohol dehydrogenase catalytic domain-containing protein n=1 Tax=Microbacterium suaedae TaxID=2067813 RepID=UPI0038CBF4E8
MPITYPLAIRGAVLERGDAARPFGASRPISVDELTLAAPQAGEMLVRMEAACICHSDLSVVDGSRRRPTPLLLGHEAAGIVEDLGPATEGFEVGDRVVMTFLPRCGTCAACETAGRLPCERGSQANQAGELLAGGRRLSRGGSDVHHHLGVSGFATHAVVDARSVVRVDADVPPDVAALLGCAVLTGGGAVLNAASPAPGSTVVVVGLGGVGMAAVLVAHALGHRVIGVDGLPHKRAVALRGGAAEAYSPEEAVEAGVRGAAVVEAAGNPRAFEMAIRLTAPGGTTVTVGLPAPEAEARVTPLDLVAQARTIVGSYLGSAIPSRDIPIFVELWRAGRLPVDELVSGVIDLEDINEGMDALASGDALRQLIRFEGRR